MFSFFFSFRGKHTFRENLSMNIDATKSEFYRGREGTSDFRHQTSDCGLQAYDFGIVISSTRCVPYTPTLMDGSNVLFFGDIV